MNYYYKVYVAVLYKHDFVIFVIQRILCQFWDVSLQKHEKRFNEHVAATALYIVYIYIYIYIYAYKL